MNIRYPIYEGVYRILTNKSGRLSPEAIQDPATRNNRIFYFPPCKGSPVSCVPVQGQAPAGLAERKSSSLRCGIFFRQTLRVRPRDCQAGEK